MTLDQAFPEYAPQDDDALRAFWQDAVIIFDTNVLLDPYRVTPPTADRLLSFFESLTDRLYFPNQTVFEFLKNRSVVISSQISQCDQFVTALDAQKTKMNRLLNQATTGAMEEGQKAIKELRDGFMARLRGDDDYLQRLSVIMGDRIGAPYGEERLKEIATEGEKRYAVNRPPGYGDKEKDGGDSTDLLDLGRRQYGDMIVWFQMLDMLDPNAGTPLSGKTLAFVTNDTKKGDWFQNAVGKSIRPRAELVREARSRGVRFWAYTLEDFFRQARTFGLSDKIPDEKQTEELQPEILRSAEHPIVSVSGLMADYLMVGARSSIRSAQSRGRSPLPALHTWLLSSLSSAPTVEEQRLIRQIYSSLLTALASESDASAREVRHLSHQDMRDVLTLIWQRNPTDEELKGFLRDMLYPGRPLEQISLGQLQSVESELNRVKALLLSGQLSDELDSDTSPDRPGTLDLFN